MYSESYYPNNSCPKVQEGTISKTLYGRPPLGFSEIKLVVYNCSFLSLNNAFKG